MRYFYVCDECIKTAHAGNLPHEDYQRACIDIGWEVEHGMNEKPAITCPSCGSDKVHRMPRPSISYQKGYGYLDRKGVANDMNLHKMIVDGADPYGGQRRPGEASDLRDSLRKKKRHTPKASTVHL